MGDNDLGDEEKQRFLYSVSVPWDPGKDPVVVTARIVSETATTYVLDTAEIREFSYSKTIHKGSMAGNLVATTAEEAMDLYIHAEAIACLAKKKALETKQRHLGFVRAMFLRAWRRKNGATDSPGYGPLDVACAECGSSKGIRCKRRQALASTSPLTATSFLGTPHKSREVLVAIANEFAANESAGSEESPGLFLIECTKHSVGGMAVWWAPCGAGYTTDMDKAGRYSYREARDIADPSGWTEALPWPLAKAEQAATKVVRR